MLGAKYGFSDLACDMLPVGFEPEMSKMKGASSTLLHHKAE